MATSAGAVHTPPSGPPPSPIQTGPNLVHFDPKAVVPSQTIYFQRNDIFSFNVFSNGTAVVLRLDYRWLTPEGEIKEGEFITAPFTGQLNFGVPLFEGWLLSFSANVTSAGAAGQWNFLQAFLGRGMSTHFTGPVSACIWQGFIPLATSNGWPGTPSKEVTDGAGVLRSITGTTPAAGAEIVETVPPNRRWTLLAFRSVLTTAVAVANRFPGFIVDDGVNVLFSIETTTAQVASLTNSYHAAAGNQFFTDGQTHTLIPFPSTLQLKAGFRIKSNTVGLQAADQYAAPQYLVIEWGAWDA